MPYSFKGILPSNEKECAIHSKNTSHYVKKNKDKNLLCNSIYLKFKNKDHFMVAEVREVATLGRRLIGKGHETSELVLDSGELKNGYCKT